MKGRVGRSVIWQAGTTIVARGTRALALFVLAKILAPADFGMFAVVYALVEGLILLSGAGLGESLVVRRDEIDEASDVTFRLALAFGAAFFVAALALAPAIDGLLMIEGGAPLFRALSAVLLIHAVRIVPLRLLERNFDFRGKLLPTAYGAVAFLAASIVVGLAGMGAWAFVAGVLAGTFVETVSLWMRSGWTPRWRWNPRLADEAIRFGRPIVFGGLLVALFGIVDRVTIARWGGAELAGAYAFAISIAALPATLATAITGTVLLPSYGALADDPARRFELHLRAAKIVGGVGALFALFVVAVGPAALRLLYGPKWDAAAPLLQILVVGGVFRLLGAAAGDFLVGIGRPRLFRALNLVQLAAAIVGVPWGFARAGATGVAVAVGASSAIALAFGWGAVAAAVGIPVRRIYMALAAPLAATAAAACLAAFSVFGGVGS